MNDRTRLATAVAICFAAVTVVGCDEPPPEKAERVRAIKPYYVADPAGGDVRRYSGTVTASNTSDLSFAVAGTVQKVNVDKGSRVTKGQLLATLDSKPFALNVQAAQAELAAATAELNNQKGERDRKLSLFKRGWVAKAAYDKAVAAYEAAEGQLSLARTRLGLAERDMSKTRLVAPFDGVIALRDINPFVEVKIGQKVLQIDSEGALEVELSVSDAVIGRLSIGTPVTIEARTVKNCGCTGRITEIGSAAGAANAVPVTAAVFESPRELLPGMAVEASVILSDDRVTRGYLVPLVAIAPGTGETRGYVFKFDPEGGVVRRTPIKSDGSISGNLVSITDGVSAGDIVAAAGVSLLRDGQRVKLMGQ